ncbi:MAG: rhodanese-like domain-containing protein [Chloroflexota bacterium]|nr:rhodanese-like domain-containing protein [Chloroflexota bacterium]
MRKSPIVSVDWLEERASDPDLVVADVRGVDSYRAGHIPGALHADLSTLRLSSSSPEAIAAWTGRLQSVVDALGLGSDKTVIFYEDFSGTMSAYGVWLLDAAGFGNGAMLDGGLRSWQGSGHPLTIDDVRPEPTSTPIQPDRSVLATASQILDSLNGPDPATSISLVDTRGANEFGMGSIPGAINVDWTRNLDAEGRFKPAGELAAMYADAGFAPSVPVASYCAGGFRAANTYVVLKALGYTGARNYAPSWGEWGQHPDTPVERHR